MTALERAKRFVRQNAATTALVIVPLAVASPATASPIFVGTTVSFGGGLSPTATNDEDFSPLPNGGVRFTGDYDFLATPSVSGSSFFIELTIGGTGSGLLDVLTIPAHYDYSFTIGPSVTGFISTVKYSINSQPVGAGGPHGASGSGSPVLTGWLPTASLAAWNVVLRAEFESLVETSVNLNIPPHSIDITPTGAAAADVPEPGSMLLLATGIGTLVLRRRRASASRR